LRAEGYRDDLNVKATWNKEPIYQERFAAITLSHEDLLHPLSIDGTMRFLGSH